MYNIYSFPLKDFPVKSVFTWIQALTISKVISAVERVGVRKNQRSVSDFQRDSLYYIAG